MDLAVAVAVAVAAQADLAVVAAVSVAAVQATGQVEAIQADPATIPLSPLARRTTFQVMVGPVLVGPAVGQYPAVARVAFPTAVAR